MEEVIFLEETKKADRSQIKRALWEHLDVIRCHFQETLGPSSKMILSERATRRLEYNIGYRRRFVIQERFSLRHPGLGWKFWRRATILTVEWREVIGCCQTVFITINPYYVGGCAEIKKLFETLKTELEGPPYNVTVQFL